MNVMMIKEVRVNIYPRMISRILHGIEFQPPINTGKINFCMDEIRKITRKQIGTEEKLVHFWWMDNFVASNREKIGWVAGGPRVNS